MLSIQQNYNLNMSKNDKEAIIYDNNNIIFGEQDLIKFESFQHNKYSDILNYVINKLFQNDCFEAYNNYVLYLKENLDFYNSPESQFLNKIISATSHKDYRAFSKAFRFWEDYVYKNGSYMDKILVSILYQIKQRLRC